MPSRKPLDLYAKREIENFVVFMRPSDRFTWSTVLSFPYAGILRQKRADQWVFNPGHDEVHREIRFAIGRALEKELGIWWGL